MSLEFLKSNRFWVLIGICIIAILKNYAIIDIEIANALITAGLGFIGIRSLDRFSEKVSEVQIKQ
jgi:hypothetical protein